MVYQLLMLTMLFSFLCYTPVLNAQTASKYPLAITTGTYSSISGTGTPEPDVLINDSCVNISGLNPGFTVNGVVYTKAIMHNNGYLMLYSGTYPLPVRYYEPNIFSFNANIVFGPFAMNLGLSSVGTTAAYYQTVGVEHIFEWKNFSRLSNGDDNLNFQVRLNTATGEIKFIYGVCLQGTGTVGPEITWKSTGISWAADRNCLMQNEIGSPAICDWSHAVTAYEASVTLPKMYYNPANPLIKPNLGLTYTWSPQNVVSPVRVFSPVTNITGSGATISWTAPTGATNYNIQYRLAGTSCNWTNWSGNPVSTNSVTLNGLLQNSYYQIRVQAINGTNQTIYSHSPDQYGIGTQYGHGFMPFGTFKTLQLPCAGMPNPGQTLVSNSTPCLGTQINLSLQNTQFLGTGVSYQWYNNSGAISGATNQTLVYTFIGADDFYCDVSCGATTGSSNLVSVTLNNPYNCTCSSTSLNSNEEDIYEVSVGGATINSLYTNGNGCFNPAPGPGSALHKYSNFKTLGNLVSVTQGDQVPFQIKVNECDGAPYVANGVALWIDYNHNGLFTDVGELIYAEPNASACTGNSPAGDKIVSGTFSIPYTALTGPTAMRVICAEGVSGTGLTPCLSYNNGETEDYLFNIQQAFPCSGTTNPGNTIASSTVACNGSTVVFSLQNQPSGTGLTYQWYSNTGLIAGATASTYSKVMTGPLTIHCAVSCSGGPVVLSNPVSVTLDTYLNCYCTSNSQSGTSGGYYGWVSHVSFGTISNLSSFPATSPFYTNYPPTASTNTSVLPGSSYPLSLIVNSGFSQAGAWFDWNQNGVFDSVEYVFLGTNPTATNPFTYTQNITVPLGAAAGQIRMRIRTQNYGFGLNGSNACSLLEYGETEDYVITINSSASCVGAPNPGNTLASSATACYGTTVNFSLQNPTLGSNVVYQWNNDAGPITGAYGAYYSQVMTAADHIFCQVKCGSGALVVASNPVFVTLDLSSACTCIPNTQSGTSSGSVGWISNVAFGSISNASSFPVNLPYYTNYAPTAGTTASVSTLNTYPLNVTLSSGHTQAAVWFDWDQNGIFDSSEYAFLGMNSSSSSPVTFSQVIIVPFNAPAGIIKMRIRSQKDIFPLNANDACSLLEFGETEDYTITVDAVALCATSLGGYFTIDQTIPTGGNNFSSFSDAANHLSCGISAPVTISVVPGTGPYNEQVYIPEIPGASAINTITILGNNEELTYEATQSYAPYTLSLDGADYFRVNSLKIRGTGILNSGTSNGGMLIGSTCQLGGGADNNIFSNCIFSSNPDYYQSTFSIKLANGLGLSGNNNLVTGCTIYGKLGIILEGNSTSSGVGNKIINCSILNFFTAIQLTGQNGSLIAGNLIENQNVTSSGGQGCYVGSGCLNTMVSKNKFRNFISCPVCIGGDVKAIEVVAIASPGNENIVSNNIISDMRQSIGKFVGINLSGAKHVKAFHNTISFDNPGTGPNSGIPKTFGIQCGSNAEGIEIRNNTISISRGGLTAKYCLYLGSTTGIICENNNLYMHSTTGTTNYIAGHISGASTLNFTTLSAWKNANGSIWDQQSISIDPGFTNPAIYDYTPLNVLVDNQGSSTSITTDINGTSRNTVTPDIGCFEFTVYPIDLGAATFVSPDSNGCYSSSVPVVVAIRNYGYAPINFGLNPATVYCTVNGTVSATLMATVSSGTLASGASMNVTLPSFNMASNGTYTFNAYTNVAGDTNFANNNLLTPITRTVGPIGGSITSVPATICVSTTPTMTLHGQYGGSIQWQQSSVSSSGPWSNVGTGGLSYTPSTAVTQTTWYRTQISCNGNSAFSSIYSLHVYDPNVVSTVNGSRCGYGPVTLSATGSGSSLLKWYENLTDNIPVATGNTFTTQNISTTTPYFVSASEGISTPMNLFTTTLSNNGSSGVIFDMNILNPIRIDSLSTKVENPGTTIQIYYRSGSGTGFNNSTSGWTYLGSAYVSTPTISLCVIPLNLNLTLQPGLYSFALKSNSSLHYTNGTGLGNLVASDSNVQIKEGYGGTGVANFSFNLSPVIWNGRLYYNKIACESPKTTVMASVNAAPPIIASAMNPTLCPGGSTTVSVSSPTNPNYTYSWISYPGSFTAIGPGPFIVSPTTTTTYTVIATDNSSGTYAGCGNISTVTIITANTVSPGFVSSSIDTICTSGFPTLTVAGASGGAIQWQSSTSSNAGPWTNVGTGLPTYIPSNPMTQTTWFRAVVSCQSTSLISNVRSVVVVYPAASILTTIGGTSCSGNSVVLSATSTSGSTPHWYDSPTGGLLVGTGNSFTTPALTSSINFYVSALPGLGGIATSVMPPEDIPYSSSAYTYGYWFTSPIAFTIKGVHVPSSGILSGSTQNIAILKFDGGITPPLFNTGGTSAFTTLFLTQNDTNIGVIPCTISIAPGDVIAIMGQRNNIASFSAFTSNPVPVAIAGSQLDFYPLKSLGGLASNAPYIVGDNLGTASSRLGRVEFEYNIGGCEEIRTPVLANVTPAPLIVITNSSPLICQGNSSVLSVSSPNDPNFTYTWHPGFMSGNTVTVTPSQTTVYTLLAVDNTTGSFATCSTQGTTTVSVIPAPVLSSITASNPVVCQGNNSTLSVSVPLATPYCAAGTSNTCAVLPTFHISNVQLAGINNASACSGVNNYENFTSVSTTLNAGSTYPISVSIYASSAWNEIFVWIDYDHDGVFSNANEETVVLASSISTGFISVATANLTIPTNALNGSTRMRIRLNNGGNPANGAQSAWNNACGYAAFGEVEDYTVNIIGGLASPYTWSPPTYLSSTSGASVNAFGMNASTTYTVTATNAYGCTKTATKTITVNPTTSSSSVVTVPCGSSYAWNGNTYTSTGIYTHTSLNAVGCDSIATLHLAVQCVTTLNLTCFIEGYWNGTTQMLPVLANQLQPSNAGVCDTIVVELHDAVTYATSATTKAVLNQNGTATCIFPLASGNKYIVVKHRNSVETWSALPVTMGQIVNYNFSDADTKAYGANQVLISNSPIKYAFFSGDIVKDMGESIDLIDLIELETGINNFYSGYEAGDLNGDGNVDILDTVMIESNISNFVFSNHP